MHRARIVLVIVFALAACSRTGSGDLWDRRFGDAAPASPAPATDVTGYWEGRIVPGEIRLKIAPREIVAALKCDVHGDVVTVQGSAPIVLRSGPSGSIVLEEPLAGDRKGCGFLFAKGSEFRYALRDRGALRIAFAGTSTADMRKLADLEAQASVFDAGRR